MRFRQIIALESIRLSKKHGLEAKIDRWLEERMKLEVKENAQRNREER